MGNMAARKLQNTFTAKSVFEWFFTNRTLTSDKSSVTTTTGAINFFHSSHRCQMIGLLGLRGNRGRTILGDKWRLRRRNRMLIAQMRVAGKATKAQMPFAGWKTADERIGGAASNGMFDRRTTPYTKQPDQVGPLRRCIFFYVRDF